MKKYRIELKWGIIFSIAAFLWMLLEKYLGWHGENIALQFKYSWIFFPIGFLIYYLALNEKKASLGDNMSWREGFKSSIITGFVIAALSPISQYIIFEVISPDYFDTIIKYSLQENSDVTESQLQDYFNLKTYIKTAILRAPIAGAVTGGIISLFLKTDKPKRIY